MASVASTAVVRTPPSPHSFLADSLLLGPSQVILRLGQMLLALGVVCRLLRYLLQFPFWGDEGMLAVNFLDRDYSGLTKTLANNQVAPLLFLWGEETALRLLGGAEWAMRLLPFVASLGGLFLFWQLARLTLPARAATFAVGILAVARWPVTMGAVVKPYSFDLFFALVLLLPAVHWLRRPDRTGWLVLLAVLVPVALLGSYPSVFVAGAVSVALMPAVWQRRSTAVVSLYLAYNVLMFATFLGGVLLVGREQLDPATGSVRDFMLNYWVDGFPPSEPWPLLQWFAAINTGRIMAYPVGESNGGSTLTLLLFLAGAWRCWRDGRRDVLVLCLLPFVLNLLAAVQHRYPYGACCRLSQHLAPAVCLLAGWGAASLFECFLSPAARGRATYLFCGLLMLCGVAQLFVDVAHPYRDDEGLWTRQVTNEVMTQMGPNDGLVVICDPAEEWSLLRWQLQRRCSCLSWNGSVDWDQVEVNGGRVWLLSLGLGERPAEDVVPPGMGDHPGWVCVAQARFTLRRGSADAPNEWCILSCWERAERAKSAARPVISCWP
jgi:Dolichyl-phosphate-mannose-protein mannosyltransferase